MLSLITYVFFRRLLSFLKQINYKVLYKFILSQVPSFSMLKLGICFAAHIEHPRPKLICDSTVWINFVGVLQCQLRLE
jgi:hypothetical protein